MSSSPEWGSKLTCPGVVRFSNVVQVLQLTSAVCHVRFVRHACLRMEALHTELQIPGRAIWTVKAQYWRGRMMRGHRWRLDGR